MSKSDAAWHFAGPGVDPPIADGGGYITDLGHFKRKIGGFWREAEGVADEGVGPIWKIGEVDWVIGVGRSGRGGRRGARREHPVKTPELKLHHYRTVGNGQ